MRRITTISIFALLLYGTTNALHGLRADIIEKEPYRYTEERRTKNALGVLVMPLAGTLSETRGYAAQSLHNFIVRNLQFHQKIVLSKPLPEHHRHAFNRNPDPISDHNALGERSLVISIMNANGISFDYRKNTPDYRRTFARENRADILVCGELVQDRDSFKARLFVYNRLFDRHFTIVKSGAFQGMDLVAKEIDRELIAALMANTGTIRIVSKPPEAMLYIDGRYFGRTGTTEFRIEAGEHSLMLRKDGHRVHHERLTIAGGQTIIRDITLVPSASPTMGRDITIITQPADARVYLDSAYQGQSPLTLRNLSANFYRLRIDKKGHISRFTTIYPHRSAADQLRFTLEKGSNQEHYFSESKLYYRLFQCSLLGMTGGLSSWFYYGFKKSNEQTYRDRNLAAGDQAGYDYHNARMKKYTEYQNYSIYAAAGFMLLSGVFYYLDIQKQDIDIAMYVNPLGFRAGGIGQTAQVNNGDRGMTLAGIAFVMRF